MEQNRPQEAGYGVFPLVAEMIAPHRKKDES
jgi:hypothetical protein